MHDQQLSVRDLPREAQHRCRRRAARHRHAATAACRRRRTAAAATAATTTAATTAAAAAAAAAAATAAMRRAIAHVHGRRARADGGVRARVVEEAGAAPRHAAGGAEPVVGGAVPGQGQGSGSGSGSGSG